MTNMKVWSTGWWWILRKKGFLFHSSSFQLTIWWWNHWRSLWMSKTHQNTENTTSESSLLLETAVISRSKKWKTSKLTILGCLCELVKLSWLPLPCMSSSPIFYVNIVWIFMHYVLVLEMVYFDKIYNSFFSSNVGFWTFSCFYHLANQNFIFVHDHWNLHKCLVYLIRARLQLMKFHGWINHSKFEVQM